VGTTRRRRRCTVKPLLSEIGQSFFLMGLMVALLGAYVGLSLLAIRVLG
jgi:hypothetical protein